ncbi:MAG: hypothetical protein DMF89_05735 [Acidobacteria bacterium]|nr:MAG: hypothetical protein DMF90_01910 [Acidobacteriota bacterium]PYR51416.1 MAG: hypothetical protein DMF89_05735 [Acidobacteriota bacterium]
MASATGWSVLGGSAGLGASAFAGGFGRTRGGGFGSSSAGSGSGGGTPGSLTSTIRGGGAGMSRAGGSGTVLACARVHAVDQRPPASTRSAAPPTRTLGDMCKPQALGSRILKDVPFPGVDCTSISPSCICTVR